MRILETEYKSLQAKVIAHPDAPQRFIVEGVGALVQAPKVTYEVNVQRVLDIIGEKKTLKLVKIGASDLKKGTTSAEYAKIEEAGAVSKNVTGVSYSFKPEKPKKTDE